MNEINKQSIGIAESEWMDSEATILSEEVERKRQAGEDVEDLEEEVQALEARIMPTRLKEVLQEQFTRLYPDLEVPVEMDELLVKVQRALGVIEED